MSDDETFESADAGAAHCIPVKAGDLKKGSFALIKGKPCKVRRALVLHDAAPGASALCEECC